MMASEYADMRIARAPTSSAARIARVCVMEMLTGEKITFASRMARATGSGGSFPSARFTGITASVTGAPVSRAASATESAYRCIVGSDPAAHAENVRKRACSLRALAAALKAGLVVVPTAEALERHRMLHHLGMGYGVSVRGHTSTESLRALWSEHAGPVDRLLNIPGDKPRGQDA